MLHVSEPGTIDDLIADAAGQGYRVTVRLIRDWTSVGLLDVPRKRSAGKGHGSRPALYAANQRELFILLLRHRPGNGIKSLARIPVAIWMYWGEDYIPLRQARRALSTWLTDPRVSMRQAHQTARQLLGQLDHPNATASARRELREALTELLYTASTDLERLERAVRNVFEPGYGRLRRAVGHPAAPLTADAVIDLIHARLTAIGLLADDAVTDQELRTARHAHLASYADYARQQPFLAAAAPAENPAMYEPATVQTAVHQCCGQLLTTLGLQRLYPRSAARITRRRPLERPRTS